MQHSSAGFSRKKRRSRRRDENGTVADGIRAIPYFIRIAIRITRGAVILEFVMGAIHAMTAAATTYLTKRMLDEITPSNISTPSRWAIALLVVGVASQLLNQISRRQNAKRRIDTDRFLVEERIALMSSLPLRRLDSLKLQETFERYDQAQSEIMHSFDYPLSLLRLVTSAVTSIALLFELPPGAALAVLANALTGLYFTHRDRRQRQQEDDHEEHHNRVRTRYFENFLTDPGGQVSLRLLGATDYFFRTWRTQSARRDADSLKETFAEESYAHALRSVAQLLLGSIGLMFVLDAVTKGTAGQGTIFVCLSGAMLIERNLEALISSVGNLRRFGASYLLYKEMQELERERTDGAEVTGALDIVFRDVSFTYPDAHAPAIEHLNLTFRTGDRIAIIGDNGAGKSTLMKLLTGIHEPSSGTITVNGIPLSELNPKGWRAQLSYLAQHPAIWSDILRTQLSYANDGVPGPRFETAVATSQLSSFIPQLPHGLETHIGRSWTTELDEPTELSGGQYQMVGLAQVLNKEASIYLFDEPTSAMSIQNSERFFNDLPVTLDGKCVIFISHSVAVLRRAERIIVMDRGGIVEDGSHHELLAQNGHYAKLFHEQAKAFTET